MPLGTYKVLVFFLCYTHLAGTNILAAVWTQNKNHNQYCVRRKPIINWITLQWRIASVHVQSARFFFSSLHALGMQQYLRCSAGSRIKKKNNECCKTQNDN